MPMTRHLAASKGLMYTFDPTKDRRLRGRLGDKSTTGMGVDRQDVVLIEAANRIREHSGLAQTVADPPDARRCADEIRRLAVVGAGTPELESFAELPGNQD